MIDHARIGVSMTAAELVGIIAQVQLALRHPANTGESAKQSEALIRKWIDLVSDDLCSDCSSPHA